MALWPDLESVEEELYDDQNHAIYMTDSDDSRFAAAYFHWWRPQAVEESYPKLEWLVEGILLENGINVLYGPSGHLKSFNARDLAISVALGEPWHERLTRRGTVCMVVAEGMAGMGVRLRAWRQGHNRPEHLPDNLRMMEHPIELLDTKTIAKFAKDIAGIARLYPEPVLIIIDTLGLCFGGDENLSKDMGTLMRHLDYLRRRLRATILLLHHTDKNAKAERGSGSLRNRADVMIRVTALKNGRVILKMDKRRDGKTGDEIHLDAHEEVLSDGEQSIVLRPYIAGSSSDRGAIGRNPDSGNSKDHASVKARALAKLVAFPNSPGIYEWAQACEISPTSLKRWAEGWPEVERRLDKKYVLTQRGAELVATIQATTPPTTTPP